MLLLTFLFFVWAWQFKKSSSNKFFEKDTGADETDITAEDMSSQRQSTTITDNERDKWTDMT